MIKSSLQRIKDYLVKCPLATKAEIVRDVFFGYTGNKNSKTNKALDKIFSDDVTLLR